MLLFSLYILSVHCSHRFRLIRMMIPIRHPTDIYSVFIPLIYLYNAKRPIGNFEEPPMGYFSRISERHHEAKTDAPLVDVVVIQIGESSHILY